MDSTKTDEALEAIDTAFAGVFWGRAKSHDGSEEVDGDSLIYIVEYLLFISLKEFRSKKKEKEDLRCE